MRSHQMPLSRPSTIRIVGLEFRGAHVLYPSFAKQFPDIQERSTTQQHRITGVGGSASIKSFTLPSLSFRLGGVDVPLKPATVLLEENNSTSAWFKGNVGMDLLNQARRVDVDFGSMTLSLK